jgi:hypothetical protein
VEVWQDALGWLTIDPPPPDLRGSGSFEKYKAPFWTRLYQQVRRVWRDYVLDYSDKQQNKIRDSITQTRLFDELQLRLKRLKTMINGFGSNPRAGHSGYRFMNLAGQVGIIIVIVAFLAAIYFLMIRLPLFRGSKRAPHHHKGSIEFMNRLVRKLKQRELIRSEAMIPAEWFSSLQHEFSPGWDSDFFLEMYYRVKYGGRPFE